MQPVHLFVDESRPHKGPYYIVAATVAVGDLHTCRKTLKQLLLPGQKQLHFQKEQNSRRLQIIDHLGQLAAPSRVYVCRTKNDVKARQQILSQLVLDMSSLQSNRLVLESRQGQDHRDQQLINKTKRNTNQTFTFDHLPAPSEPLLWIPDAIAWCYGNKDKSWRNRIQNLNLVSEVVDVTET